MRKNNKGIALAYTLMIMLFVFAICAVITSITLAQVASTDRYSDSAETERIYLQIGEIFCSTQNDANHKKSFALALQDSSFIITSEIDSDEWNVEFEDYNFILVFSTDTNRNNLKIQNANGTKTYLTVGVKDGKIVEWTKGTADGQNS